MATEPARESVRSASLMVVDPNGHRSRVEIAPLPFRIGRHADNHLIVRDSRASRNHARIIFEAGEYILEDLGSRHGVFVNGLRVERHALKNSDRIEFGVPDSWQLIFALDGAELGRLMDHFAEREKTPSGRHVAIGGNLQKLRAVLEVARTLQSSFSIDDVLNSLVDAALAVTGAERGFLLLRSGAELDTRVARDNHGRHLSASDLRVPRRVLHRALQQRRELLSMNFDPSHAAGEAGNSVADLELRSVVCVPIVRINAGAGHETAMLTAANETAGVLYMDSRAGAADLSSGNRELLQTLAIEASTILENARLLEEEREKHRMEEELNVARAIQQSLLPPALPGEGWFRASGSSVASRRVGGDYYDVLPVADGGWAAVVADVSGKGVSSALLASLLQGAFLTSISGTPDLLEKMMERLNQFLNERTGGGKYATVFCSMLGSGGLMRYINAGHCAPVIISAKGAIEYLETTAMPVGLLEAASFAADERQLAPGDRVVIYTDGVTEAQSPDGEFFGRKRLREAIAACAATSCVALHDAIRTAVMKFIDDAPQADDITLVVLEYRPQ